MTNLITITPAAIAQLKRIAEEEIKLYRIRIAMKGGGCSGFTVEMDFTKWPPDPDFDTVLEQDGIEFLVDKKSALFIQGATLDYSGGLLDKGFKWEFPNSTGGCGCGVSFSF